MKFGRLPLAQALGGILAHSLRSGGKMLRKGALIDAAATRLIAAAGHGEITVAQLEPGDVPEGEAAIRLGALLLGPHLRRSAAINGRVNIFSQVGGLLRLAPGVIERLNRANESVTLATLPDRAMVAEGDMVATLKIIPFAVSAAAMDTAQRILRAPAFRLEPFQALTVGLVLTELPHVKEATLQGTIAATQSRIAARGGTMLPALRTPHQEAPLTAAIRQLLADGAGLILIAGASAVTDRQDVAPRAVVASGGTITRFGMPVDPGNLICFGEIAGLPAIILPGCARSPAANGIDWVLDRIFVGETITSADIAAMGVGGLLKETDSRPMPRARARITGIGAAPRTRPQIAALVMAAGLSRRMAPANKLLLPMPDGRLMIAQTVDHALASGANPVIVVTGHQDAEIKAALAGRQVQFTYAADYAAGMSASLRAGIAALPATASAVLVCLGDMPLVAPETLNRIITAFDPAEGREIIIPVHAGKRGNPVLWARRFFPDLQQLTGDSGARQIMHGHTKQIAEFPAPATILYDFDTPAGQVRS